MKTHFAYVYKKLLQTYHNTGFFWLLKSQTNNMAGRAFLCAFLRKLRHKPADVNLFIKVYYLPISIITKR